MTNIRAAIEPKSNVALEHRASHRRAVTLPARLTWKDRHGTTRFASVVVRDVSEFGVYVETLSTVPLSLYRLVHFQLEREVREFDALPTSLRQGRLLSAVYRVTPANPSGRRQGFGLRLMVDPKRRGAVPERERATA